MLCSGIPFSCSAACLLCSQKISSNCGFDAWERTLLGKEQGGSMTTVLLVFCCTWLSSQPAGRAVVPQCLTLLCSLWEGVESLCCCRHRQQWACSAALALLFGCVGKPGQQ